MSTEKMITVRRNGEVLGTWDKFEVRQFIASGALLLTDEFVNEEAEEWKPLVPAFRRRHLLFDWAEEDDALWFYVREGMIYGPRTGAEIEALLATGYLSDDNLVCTLGAPSWERVGDLTAEEHVDPEASDERHWEAAKGHAMSGNLWAAAANAGLHILGKTPKPQPPGSQPSLPEG